jgi:hypothetical protein
MVSLSTVPEQRWILRVPVQADPVATLQRIAQDIQERALDPPSVIARLTALPVRCRYHMRFATSSCDYVVMTSCTAFDVLL